MVWFLASAGASLAADPNPSPLGSSPSVATNIPTLTRAAQILELSPKQVQANLPVRIRGVVTCYDPGMVFFVQDETGGVFVYYRGDRLPLLAGKYVEITGSAKPGRYSAIIDPARIQTLDGGPTITPRAVSLAQVYFGGLDAQWVELTGVVRSQKLSNERLNIELADPPNRIGVWIPDYKGFEDMPLTGSLVRIRGVVGASTDAQGHVGTFQVFGNTLADITVLHPGPKDLFSGPSSLIRDLSAPRVRTGMTGLARVQGVVTLHWPGRALFIQDSTGGLEVRTKQPLEGLAPGTFVDVAGFVGPVPEAPRLEDALIRRLGGNAPPQPASLLAGDLFGGLHNNQLIEVESRVLGLTDSPSNCPVLALQVGKQVVTALLDAPQPQAALTALQPGCRLRVTGVCYPQAGPGPGTAVSLLLRSPMDIQVIGYPASRRTIGLQALTTCAILTSVGLAVALWFIQKQRRRTERVLQLQVALQSEMRQGEEQLRRSMEERERIGRDLHDDIIQSIYAVGLSLEDFRRVVRQSPEQAEPRLAAAVSALNNTIRIVRGFIAGLEPKVLNGREFKTALKSLALTSGEGPTQFQIEVDAVGANRLTSTQATQLLHIAKEAMSNSLRHAHATGVAVSLHPVGSGVRLEIHDDGAGFDPGAIGGTGQGLRNMTARAREIGADLQIISAPGQGCRIVVTVPQRNSHGPE